MSIASDTNTSVFGYKPNRDSKCFIPTASHLNTISLFCNNHIAEELINIQDDIVSN
jgi:hypothetical protein